MPSLLRTEIDRAGEKQPVPKFAQRPLRWRAFLEASPYANPLQDLIGRWTDRMDKTTPSQKQYKHIGQLDFTDSQLIIMDRSGGKPLRRFGYGEMRDLKIYAVLDGWPAAGPRQSTILFTYGGREFKYGFQYHQRSLKTVCEHLLEYGVPFKEFLQGSRVHLGQSLSYQEIQEVKKQYGVKW
ncbi:hypothetical protein [Lewinella sp. W8]|uniref:hypothetical protein n=1 Tax=Lewinella sp. W8 TaxID=2528208 RepID=UPI001068B4A9|nr:hypothetical protein [Lewinella sp. W8]MTB50565.1 hypothetical protein [Lewinella sp. W8]